MLSRSSGGVARPGCAGRAGALGGDCSSRMPDAEPAMGGDLMAREWDVPGYTEGKGLGSGGVGEVVLARHDASGTGGAGERRPGGPLGDSDVRARVRAGAACPVAPVSHPDG